MGESGKSADFPSGCPGLSGGISGEIGPNL